MSSRDADLRDYSDTDDVRPGDTGNPTHLPWACRADGGGHPSDDMTADMASSRARHSLPPFYNQDPGIPFHDDGETTPWRERWGLIEMKAKTKRPVVIDMDRVSQENADAQTYLRQEYWQVLLTREQFEGKGIDRENVVVAEVWCRCIPIIERTGIPVVSVLFGHGFVYRPFSKMDHFQYDKPDEVVPLILNHKPHIKDIGAKWLAGLLEPGKEDLLAMWSERFAEPSTHNVVQFLLEKAGVDVKSIVRSSQPSSSSSASEEAKASASYTTKCITIEKDGQSYTLELPRGISHEIKKKRFTYRLAGKLLHASYNTDLTPTEALLQAMTRRSITE